MKEKIVLVGAGSAMFTLGLVADLLFRGEPTDIALVDTNPEALEIAERLVHKMITTRKAPFGLSASVDRRDVLAGATAVICTIGVGSRRAWEQDVFIPRKYGIYMPVGDTVGPGGSSRALRMIPQMVDIAKDVLDMTPEALFFNYGNPMAPVCRAVRKETGANMVGLCHGVNHIAHYLARHLEVPVEQLQYTAIGINHLTWFTQIRTNGKDAMPRLREIAAKIIASSPAADIPYNSAKAEEFREPFNTRLGDPFAWHMFQLFGAFPAVVDRHVSEFFPQFFREGWYYGQRLGVEAFSFEGTIAVGDRIYEEMAIEAHSPNPLPEDYFERLSGEHEQVMDIIDSIRHESRKVYSANLPNTGQVPNLPAGAIVEAPAIADGEGLRPIAQPPLPAGVAGTLATRFQWVETIVEAAVEGSRDKFIQALVLDGAVKSLAQATALADELLEAQKPHLPQFFK
jgi:alpha-galactosidase